MLLCARATAEIAEGKKKDLAGCCTEPQVTEPAMMRNICLSLARTTNMTPLVVHNKRRKRTIAWSIIAFRCWRKVTHHNQIHKSKHTLFTNTTRSVTQTNARDTARHTGTTHTATNRFTTTNTLKPHTFSDA